MKARKVIGLADRVADQILDRVDRVVDRAAALRTPPAPSAPAAATPVRAPAAAAAVSSTPSKLDTAAFESVPKEELAALLAKTTARCRQLDARYSELRKLHEGLLNKRQAAVVGTPDAKEAEAAMRAHLHAELRATYDDRLTELEEQASASGAIKQTLQLEVAKLTAAIEAERAARERAEADARASAQRAAEASDALHAAEVAAASAAREADAAKEGAASERAMLVRQLSELQGQLGAGGGGQGSTDAARGGEVAKFYEERAAQAAAAIAASEGARAAAEASASAAQREVAKLTSRAESAEEELETKSTALKRALGNYRDEVKKWGARLQKVEDRKADAAARASAELEAAKAQHAREKAEMEKERDDLARELNVAQRELLAIDPKERQKQQKAESSGMAHAAVISRVRAAMPETSARARDRGSRAIDASVRSLAAARGARGERAPVPRREAADHRPRRRGGRRARLARGGARPRG